MVSHAISPDLISRLPGRRAAWKGFMPLLNWLVLAGCLVTEAIANEGDTTLGDFLATNAVAKQAVEKFIVNCLEREVDDFTNATCNVPVSLARGAYRFGNDQFELRIATNQTSIKWFSDRHFLDQKPQEKSINRRFSADSSVLRDKVLQAMTLANVEHREDFEAALNGNLKFTYQARLCAWSVLMRRMWNGFPVDCESLRFGIDDSTGKIMLMIDSRLDDRRARLNPKRVTEAEAKATAEGELKGLIRRVKFSTYKLEGSVKAEDDNPLLHVQHFDLKELYDSASKPIREEIDAIPVFHLRQYHPRLVYLFRYVFATRPLFNNDVQARRVDEFQVCVDATTGEVLHCRKRNF